MAPEDHLDHQNLRCHRKVNSHFLVPPPIASGFPGGRWRLFEPRGEYQPRHQPCRRPIQTPACAHRLGSPPRVYRLSTCVTSLTFLSHRSVQKPYRSTSVGTTDSRCFVIAKTCKPIAWTCFVGAKSKIVGGCDFGDSAGACIPSPSFRLVARDPEQPSADASAT
jgi:hypothetical protein